MTTSIASIELFHTGIVVDDVDAAKAEVTDALGVAWGPEGEADMPVWLPEGPSSITFRYAYSDLGPHRLELVRRIPDTLWTVAGSGHTHHLGHWCADVPGVSKELEQRGLPLVAKVGVDTAAARAPIVYHQAKNGFYIELIDVALRSAMFEED
jgi:hypothetical protein